MANPWQIRAEKFMKQFAQYIPDFDIMDKYDRCDYVEEGVQSFNMQYHRRVEMVYGSARICLIGPDYVIKMDYDDGACGLIGGCEREYQVYQKLSRTPYSYLLAPMHRFMIDGKYYYAMRRVNHIGDYDYAEMEYGWDDDERAFLKKYMCDLHAWNVGMYKGKGVVIDYACPSGHWNFTAAMH